MRVLSEMNEFTKYLTERSRFVTIMTDDDAPILANIVADKICSDLDQVGL